MSNKNKDLDAVISGQISKQSDIDIDSEDLAIQRDLKKLKVKRYFSDTLDRKWLAIWTAVVVSFWLLAVLFILIFNHSLIGLDNTVLAVLLGTTTLNVLGLSFIVLRGHFQSSK